MLAFSLIPAIVYLIWFRKKTTFWNFLGLKHSVFKANALAAIASTLFLLPPLILVIIDPAFKEVLAEPSTMTGRFAEMGWGVETMVIIFSIAVIKTYF